MKRSTMESVTVHRLLHVVSQKKPGVDEETLKAATEAFGVGLATMEGNCGALSGAAMVLGLIHKDRKKTTEDIRAIMTEFKEIHTEQ